MYHLLDLYATMPETKTVQQRISISPEATEKTVKKQLIGQHDVKMPSVNREEDDECINTPIPPTDVITPERSRLVVFGVAKIQKTRLLATLSGLKVKAVKSLFDEHVQIKNTIFSWKQKSDLCIAPLHGVKNLGLLWNVLTLDKSVVL